MEIYTIGFTQKSAEEFFQLLSENGIECVVDIRLRPTSQLSGFSKQDDLSYFLKELIHCDYVHLPELAPTKEILSDYRQDKNWDKYERRYLQLLKERNIATNPKLSILKENKCCFLCSEATADKCHRRLLAEYLSKTWNDVTIIHL